MSAEKKIGIVFDKENQALAAPGLPLYRFFNTEEKAEALLNGKVWLSTLQKCREYDDPQQGDKHEGTAIYKTSIKTGDREVNKEEQQRALYAGVGIADGLKDITLRSIECDFVIPNGYILCTTNDPKSLIKQSPEWRFGVQINLNQSQFFILITRALMRRGIRLKVISHGWADYDTQRIFYDYKKPPQNLAFIKPNLHKHQSEYRFFWEADEEHNYKEGILIDCPEIKPFLEKFL